VLIVLLSMGILLFVIGVMSIGVIMGREPIKGSCGGMSAVGMKTACDVCGGDANRCEKNEMAADQPKAAKQDLAYAAPTGGKRETL
jgi:uncharacterized protein